MRRWLLALFGVDVDAQAELAADLDCAIAAVEELRAQLDAREVDLAFMARQRDDAEAAAKLNLALATSTATMNRDILRMVRERLAVAVPSAPTTDPLFAPPRRRVGLS